MMSDLPSSSTLVVKSVPFIVICAVGVETFTFAFLIFYPAPEVNLAVPCAILIDILDREGFGS